jgi:hypothetical protein
MTNKTKSGIAAGILFCSAFLAPSQDIMAQKYTTISDTTGLNKEYGKVKLEKEKLMVKLTEEKNKTADYQSKSSSTAVNAAATAEDSKSQAAIATNGNTSDTEKAVKDAKRANRRANDAKDAVADEKNSNKRIAKLTDQINEKQKQLDDLDRQRNAILNQYSGNLPVTVKDSVLRN